MVQRFYAADGTPAADEAVVNTSSMGPQILPVIAQRPASDATILWSGGGTTLIDGEGERQDSLFASDDFARPDDSGLGSGWVDAYGGFAVASEAAVTAADKSLATLVEDAPVDVSVSGSIAVADVIGAFAGFAARVRDGIDSPLGDTMYWGGLRRKADGYVALIRRSIDGFWETLSQQPVASGSGLVTFEVIGDSLKLFLDGTLVRFVRDRVLTAAGEVGFRSTAGTAVDDFTVAAVMLPTATFPFRDDFALADGSQLDRFWDARSGNFTVEAGRLAGANPVNTTTLRAALASDATIGMTAETPIAGSHAGMLARGVPQRNTAYWGGLVNRSGGLAAEIWRIVDGRVTVLATSSLAAAADVEHDLQFSLAGSDLSLTVNGSPVVAAVDTALSAPGLFGMRATSGATIDAFVIETV